MTHVVTPERNKRTSRKREAVLEAASFLFCAEGYANASMDAVAARAGVSKATLYAHFPSKQQLFVEVMSAYVDDYIRLPEGFLDLPTPQGLRLIAERFTTMITSPGAMAVHRAVMTEGHLFPEMVDAFRAAGPRRVHGVVADYFRAQMARGRLNVPDPELTASLFLHLVKGETHIRALIGSSICTRPLAEVMDEAIRIILAAYAPGPAATS